MSTSRSSAAALLVPLLLAAAGCSGTSGSSSEPSAAGEERVRGSLVDDTPDQETSDAEDRVARLRDATPAQIFEAGGPQTLGVRPDGSLITAWLVSADTEGEGPLQQAWRTFDAEGRLVAEATMFQTGEVLAVDDGFLVLDGPDGIDARHVDPGGDLTPVRRSGRAGVPRRGDTLVPYGAFYRPSDGVLRSVSVAPEVRAPGLAEDKTVAVSDTGHVYERDDPWRSPFTVGVTDDGGDRWRYTDLDLDGVEPTLIAAHGDDAVIVLAPRGSSTGIAALSVTEGAGRTWRQVGAPEGMPADAYVDHLAMDADGRALVGAYGTGWWRALAGDPVTYAQLPLPPDGVSEVRASQDRLWAISSTAIWWSDDDGEYWTRFDVSG